MMTKTIRKYAMGSYIEYLPNDYKEKLYPVLLFLHGMGERGTDVNLIERNEIPKLLKNGFEAPFIVIVFQLPSNQGGYYQSFWKAIRPVLEMYEGDKHLAGLSLGGIGGFNLLSYEKDYFKTFGCCCGSDVPKAYDLYRNVHIKAWHGDQDNTVKITSIKNTIVALQSVGADSQLKIYAGLGHNIWNLAFSTTDPEGYWAWINQYIKPQQPDNIELVTKIEIINGQRVRYTVEGSAYEHDL